MAVMQAKRGVSQGIVLGLLRMQLLEGAETGFEENGSLTHDTKEDCSHRF